MSRIRAGEPSIDGQTSCPVTLVFRRGGLAFGEAFFAPISAARSDSGSLSVRLKPVRQSLASVLAGLARDPHPFPALRFGLRLQVPPLTPLPAKRRQ